jgi:serine/threonine protein kinase
MSNETGAVAPVNALPVGTRLAEYVVRSVIGEGGFGIVYLASDEFLGRQVAIKEYLPGSLAMRGAGLQVEVRQADKRELFMKGMKRFVNEAHILAKFRHPALVSVMRYLEANGTAYMVMPFYQGKTLREQVRNGFRATTTEDLFRILLPVLEGLSQIHSVECYHLDISSDNIMILESGAPVLLDFGAARHTELTGEDSTTIILKPGFAPIEQYGSDDSELALGPWTDIYAISAVAYLLVTGNMPPVSVTRIMKDSLKPAVSYASPDLPAGLLKIIDEGLAVRPQGRPQTVEACIQAILASEDFVSSETESETSFLLTQPLQIAPVPPPVAPPVMPPVAPPVANITYSGINEPGRSSAAVRWGALFGVMLVFMVVVFSVGDRKGSAENRQLSNFPGTSEMVKPLPDDYVQ